MSDPSNLLYLIKEYQNLCPSGSSSTDVQIKEDPGEKNRKSTSERVTEVYP